MVMKNLIIQFQNRAGRQTCKLKMCLVLNVIVSTNGVQHETLCVHVMSPLPGSTLPNRSSRSTMISHPPSPD